MGKEYRSEWRVRSIGNKEKRTWVEYFMSSLGRCIITHVLSGGRVRAVTSLCISEAP